MTTLFTVQLALPLIFVAWIALASAHSRLGLWVSLFATAAGLLTIGLTGLWLLPPWWGPYAFGALLLLAMAIGLRRRRPFNSTRPFGRAGWASAVFFAAFGGVALYLAAPALEGRSPPTAKLLDLAFPMEKGTYLVVNGGYHISINAHLKTLDLSVPQFKAWRGQSYGVDIVKINAAGLRSSGMLPPEPGADVI